MKIFRNIIVVLCILFVCYLWWIVFMNIFANLGFTNARSEIFDIEPEEIEVYQLPDEILQAQCVQFILNGIENRKLFNDTLKEYSEKLWVDYYIVISAILWEQLRISCKGYRGELKDIIVKWTPTLFRSYDISVWIAWLKVGTARKIKKDAIAYWYWEELEKYTLSEENIAKNDELSAKLAVYLVKNIIHRWELAWYDISSNPGVIWTLYNMWNPDKKEPHADPQIWWSVVDINGTKFLYWELSLWIYNYLTAQSWSE